jgi:hypothetical protein
LPANFFQTTGFKYQLSVFSQTAEASKTQIHTYEYASSSEDNIPDGNNGINVHGKQTFSYRGQFSAQLNKKKRVHNSIHHSWSARCIVGGFDLQEFGIRTRHCMSSKISFINPRYTQSIKQNYWCQRGKEQWVKEKCFWYPKAKPGYTEYRQDHFSPYMEIEVRGRNWVSQKGVETPSLNKLYSKWLQRGAQMKFCKKKIIPQDFHQWYHKSLPSGPSVEAAPKPWQDNCDLQDGMPF